MSWGNLATLEYGKGLRGYQNFDGQYPVFGTNGQIGWHNECLCPSEGVIVGRKGAYRGIHYSDSPFFVIDTAFYLKPIIDGSFSTKWAYYQLLDFDINTMDSGSAIPSTSRDAFYAIQLYVPPFPTQRKIAAILSAYDDLIENNLRRIKILEKMAQNLYREWFVKFRFPGHQHARFTDSPIGPIPQGWEAMALGELVNTQYGYTESAQEKPVGPKYLRGMDINKKTYIDWDAVPYCPIPANQLHKYQLAEGDIVIIRMADPGKVGIVEKEVDAVFASYLVRLSRKSNRIGPYYLFHFLIDERYQGYITGASTGTTRKSASAGVLTGIDILIPPEPILADFESHVLTFRRLLNNLLERNTTLRSTRDLLLPRLISGEVDVSELDIAVPEEDTC